ncbi:MAG: hypothetical protein ACOCW1_04865 [Chitinispirillaceae bacterium]
MLIASDGTERIKAVSGVSIKNDQGELLGVVLIICPDHGSSLFGLQVADM